MDSSSSNSLRERERAFRTWFARTHPVRFWLREAALFAGIGALAGAVVDATRWRPDHPRPGLRLLIFVGVAALGATASWLVQRAQGGAQGEATRDRGARTPPGPTPPAA